MNPQAIPLKRASSRAFFSAWCMMLVATSGCNTVNSWIPEAPALLELDRDQTYVIRAQGAPWFARPIRSTFDQPNGRLAAGTQVTLVDYDAYQAQVQLPTGRDVFVHPSTLVQPQRPAATRPQTSPRPRPTPARPSPPQPEPEPKPEPEPLPLPEMRLEEEFDIE